ncbi:RNA polymerase sigma factor [Streptomyces sp. NPDC056486]|uniref:RNA polymerase sigma factor n=1 Tax=Streptomyces sp. NPDC056486 TaxID=3345835 RepID=UPI00369663C0
MDGPVAMATQRLRAELPLKLEVPFEAFTRQMRVPYQHYLSSKLASASEAREELNAFFLKLHVRWQTVLRSENVTAFAWKMLHDHAVDALRNRDRRPVPMDTAFLPVHSYWAVECDPIDALLTRLDIYRALQLLTPGQRECFWLRHVLGYTAVEIADLTGRSASTVRTHLQHATEDLKEALMPDEGWGMPAPRKES